MFPAQVLLPSVFLMTYMLYYVLNYGLYRLRVHNGIIDAKVAEVTPARHLPTLIDSQIQLQFFSKPFQVR